MHDNRDRSVYLDCEWKADNLCRCCGFLSPVAGRGVGWARDNEGLIVDSLVANAGRNVVELTVDGARAILRLVVERATAEDKTSFALVWPAPPPTRDAWVMPATIVASSGPENDRTAEPVDRPR
jgi:hypothetical protein